MVCPRKQHFTFSFAETVFAEAGGVPLDALHADVDAIIKAADAMKPIAERMGVPAPQPRIAGFCYTPVVPLGVKIVFPPGSQPTAFPIIEKPEDIDCLKQPEDYLKADLIQQRLKTLSALKERRPDAAGSIGHNMEGPITMAMLLMGPDFLTLPYDDPERAHRLLEFSVTAVLGYAAAIREHFGGSAKPGRVGIPDDFAGLLPPSLFGEFVVPYWEKIYEGLEATNRFMHSELLHVEHLPFLEDAKINCFDPSADQYLTTEILQKHCPCSYTARVHAWHVRDMSIEELGDYYKHLASFDPVSINISMWRLEDEPKAQALLEVAREMAA